MNKSLLLSILFVPVLLGGCASGSVSTSQAITIAVNKCPSLKQYTKEQLLKAASELKAMPTGTQISAMLTDYSKLRDACRIAERKLRSAKFKTNRS